MNAALFAQDKESWSPKRSEAYIGVLIDDLITSGTSEPYRMFTSRAEYRLMLREDNADLRLTAKGHELGLVNNERFQRLEKKRDAIEKEKQRLKTTWVSPDTSAGDALSGLLEKPLSHEYNLIELLRRPELNYESLMQIEGIDKVDIDPKVAEQVEIQIKYAGYIDRQQIEIDKQQRHEHTKLPEKIDYKDVSGLSNEVIQKLNEIKPANIGQASRISGVTPAAISILLVHLKKTVGYA